MAPTPNESPLFDKALGVFLILVGLVAMWLKSGIATS
jgi:hypothetical protein